MEALCKIRDLQRAVTRFEGLFEERFGLSLNEAMVLCTLSNSGRMCPGGLGEMMGLTPSNMSKVLRSVERKGYVVRELCCEDRRQTFYVLTEAGGERLRTMDCHAIELPELLRDWVEKS